MTKTKDFIIFLLLIFNVPSYAEVLEIVDIEKTELDGAFSLIGYESNIKVVLDCSSFNNNLTVNQDNETYLYYISHHNCVEDFKSLIKVPEVRGCLNYNEDDYFISDCSDISN